LIDISLVAWSICSSKTIMLAR